MIQMRHNVSEIRALVQEFGRKWGIAVVQPVLYEQMALWGKDLAKTFVPSTKFGGGKKYEKTVAGDIGFIIKADKTGDRSSKPVMVAGEPFQLILNTKGKVRFVPKALWRPGASMSELEAYHSRFRDDTGHVSSKLAIAEWNKGKRTALYSGRQSRRVKHGNLPVDNRLHTSAGALSEFIRNKKSHVGKLKAGWIDAMYHWSFLAGKNIRITEAWVGRHSGKGLGDFGGKIDAQGNGTIVSTNRVPWAHRFRRLLDATVATRKRDILLHLAKRSREVLAETGFTRGVGRRAA